MDWSWENESVNKFLKNYFFLSLLLLMNLFDSIFQNSLKGYFHRRCNFMRYPRRIWRIIESKFYKLVWSHFIQYFSNLMSSSQRKWFYFLRILLELLFWLFWFEKFCDLWFFIQNKFRVLPKLFNLTFFNNNNFI